MERLPVQSSIVISIGYDAEAQVLDVEYKGTGVYRYADVPAFLYDALLASPSVGKFLHQRIKPVYPAVKVVPAP